MIVVFGAGRQGEGLLYALMQLGHDPVAIDQTFSSNVRDMDINKINADVTEQQDLDSILVNSNPDLVISCLPYFLNKKVAKTCIDNKIPYFDLGGHVGTSKAINDYSVEHDGKVFTDLGLAPGWVNILAEECYRQLNKIGEVTDVNMYCGGLPQNFDNPPFNYKRTWSTEGLINEYKDHCWILEDYTKVQVSGMSNITHYYSHEAFCTSGGMGKTLELMDDRGVKNCVYQTLRIPGHIEAVKTLLNAGFDYKDFEKLFPTTDKDMVYLAARSSTEKNGYYSIAQNIKSDNRFTAMQKCTAFPVASIAEMFINHHGNLDPTRPYPLDYSDVDYNEFSSILGDLLGIKL